MMTHERWKELCEEVTDQMKIFTRPFVTPLVSEATGEKARIGSGTYIDLSDDVFDGAIILTCEHVARYQPQQHRPYGSDILVPLSGTLCSDRDPIDSATVRIGKSTWLEQVNEAGKLSMKKFSPKHDPVKDEILFFRGLSGENAYAGFGGFDAIVTGYCSQEKRATGDDQVFEIFWEPGKIQITQGTNENIQKIVRYDNAEGFSGALVWNTRFVETGCDIKKWKPSDSVITGMLRRWDTSTQTLLAWRVEHLLAWLKARPQWA